MCGGFFSSSAYESSEEYRKDNPEYKYTKYTDATGRVAFLLEDTQEPEPSLRFDVVYPRGNTLGWGSKEECLLVLANEGFKEAESEVVNAG